VAIAELYLGPLSSPPDALEQLRLALDEAPLDAHALELVRQIAETDDDLRLEAAAVLEPLLRAGQRWADVAAVLELSLRSHTEPSDRARTLRLLATLQSSELGSPSEALAALLRALDETPEDDSLHAELEPLAASVEGGLARYADAMSARVASVLDADLSKSLHVRIGRLAEEKLADPKRAAEAYAAAVQAVGDQPELLAALDRLYTQLGDAKALAAVLESRVSVADSDAAAASLLHRLATLQLERFGDASQALQTLRTALERDAAHPATRATLEALVGLSGDAASARPELFDEGAELLEGVYRVAADHKARAALAGRRIALLTSPSERVRQRLDLARILEEGGDSRAALDALLVALSDDPVDPDVLAEIERLAPACDGWSPAAKALEAAVSARDDLASDAQRDTLERLGTWYRDRVTDAGAAERAFEKLAAIDPSNEASLRAIESLQRAPGREADLVGTLRRLAKLDSLSGDAAPLRREAKALAEGLGDKEQVEQILREALAVDESDVWALAELCAARQAAADWTEVATLLDRRIELADSAPARAELRYEAADLAASKLGDAAKAIDLYQALFEEDPTDTKASKGLRELLQKAERFKDLLALLEELSRMAETPEARTTLRLECAAVCLEKLDLPSQAADHLREVLEENPTHERATELLAQLYEREGRDQELADLYTAQLEQAAERGDTARELALRVKLGEMCETRLGDLPRAIASYDSVLQRDPGHAPALSALARLHEQRGDKAAAAKAVAGLLDVVKGDESVALTLRLADLHASLDDAASARAALERGLALHPAHAELRKRLQAAYEQDGAWAELAELVERGTELTTDTAEQLSLLKRAAEIHRDKRSDQAKVADVLERATVLAPTDRDLLLALCDAYSLSGKADKAIEALEKIKESFGKARSKELAVILLRLAKAHAAAGNEQNAIDELEAASRIDAGNIALLKERGVYSIELARKAEPGAARDAHLERANKSFQALLMQRLDASSPITKAELYFQIAITASLKGDDKRAVQMLERSLDADKAYAPSKEMLAKLKG
jgi:tetratricopeptide (TPR) repeat protein